MRNLYSRASALAPGLAAVLIVAAAATFLSQQYAAPVMLYALLLGMALNFLGDEGRGRAGIEFASKVLLRLGVALLGLRIGWNQVAELGWAPALMVVGLIAATIAASVGLARLMGFNPLFGFLSGGATAICGASAALALSAALPAHPRKEQATLFTVIGVSVFSTVAMIAYPPIARLAGLDDHSAGLFIGATIHDVAQVVGAGYAMSLEAGDTATIVKMMRVAMLLPVVLVAGQITRRQSEPGAAKPPLLPWFVTAFIALILANSLLPLPPIVVEGGNALSRWCLVAAIAALGMKTRLDALVKLGWRPVLLIALETLLLAVGGLTAVSAIGD